MFMNLIWIIEYWIHLGNWLILLYLLDLIEIKSIKYIYCILLILFFKGSFCSVISGAKDSIFTQA